MRSTVKRCSSASAWVCNGCSRAAPKPPGIPGLSLFPAMIEKFPSEVKSPHVGWNNIEIAPGSRLLKDVPDQAFVYYTHSYRAPIVSGTVANNAATARSSAAWSSATTSSACSSIRKNQGLPVSRC